MGKLVNVVKDFTLLVKEEGQIVEKKFKAGVQKIEDAFLDHWYTKAHVEDVATKADSKATDPAPVGDGADGKTSDPAPAGKDAAPTATDVAKSADSKATQADSKA